MASCYYLLNHTTKTYLDLGKRISTPAEFYRQGDNVSTTDAQLVEWMLERRGDELQLVSDASHELDFLDTYEASIAAP